MSNDIKGYNPPKINSSFNIEATNKIDINLKVYNPTNQNSNTTSANTNSVEINLSDFVEENVTPNINYATTDSELNKEETSSIAEMESETKANVTDYGRAFLASFIGGFLDIGEGVVDSHIYGTTKTINATRLDKAFGWTEDYDEKIMGYDFSDYMREGYYQDISENAKDSWVSKQAFNLGRGVGYIALAGVPYVGVALCAIGGAGSKIERSINKQMEETGCVNDFTVFFDSFIGSVEGFVAGYAKKTGSALQDATKNDGVKNLLKGFGRMFSKGKTTGFKELLKSNGPVIINTIKENFKDGLSLVETGAKQLDTFKSIFDDGSVDFEDIFNLINPFGSKRVFQFLGKSGMEYLQDFNFK